ncbi:MAG: DUF3473 domain-containing protein [Phycisphaerales bacterium]|nr:DUF3473 domain-containing protein [Phycisphaerales bacterium]
MHSHSTGLIARGDLTAVRETSIAPQRRPFVTRETLRQPINAMSVDVEDWAHSTLGPELPLSRRFETSTRRILDAFAARGVRGTFFVLGLAAEKAPHIVREIQAAGHEVQSHGYGHENLHDLTPERFRADMNRSKKMLEDMTGVEIYAYRAPFFTITRKTLWALDVLVEEGFRYDSSVFPMKMKRYGIEGAPTFPHRLRTPAGYEILELPVATCTFAGRQLPVGGGGYFRLFPYRLLRRGVTQLNAAGHGATIYMHPYEYDPLEFREIDVPVSWKLRLHQSIGRRGFPRKVDRMLAEFRFGTMQDVIDATEEWPVFEHRPAQVA